MRLADHARTAMFDTAARRKLVRACGLEQGRVLDVGMGDCACMSFFLARRGLDVIGIDSSPQAVHDARRKAERRRFKGTFEARRADAEDLSFQDGEFDAVAAYHSLHHVGDVKKVLGEMHRVCRKGGFVLISDFHRQGQEACGEELDGDTYLSRIEQWLTQRMKTVRKLRTRLNVMFVCEK